MRVDCAWRENQGFFGAAPKHPPQALWSIRSHILAYAHPVHRLSISIYALHIAQCSLGVFRAACNRGPSARAPLAGSTQFWPCLIAPRHWRDLPSGDTSRSRGDRAQSCNLVVFSHSSVLTGVIEYRLLCHRPYVLTVVPILSEDTNV